MMKNFYFPSPFMTHKAELIFIRTWQAVHVGDNLCISNLGGDLVVADGAEERGGCADEREDEADARRLGGLS